MSVSTIPRVSVDTAAVNVGRIAFAAMMIFLGIQGLKKGDFTVVWQGVPQSMPAREALAYLCAVVSLLCGVGLLLRRTARVAAIGLLSLFAIWFLVWRIRALFLTFRVDSAQFLPNLVGSTWSSGQNLVMIAASWIPFVAFATDGDRRRLGFVADNRGVRIATALYGLGLIPFGYAHFAYPQNTTVLIPGWLPWHAFWAYFTGVTFIVAGLAIITGICGRLAATLSLVQMALFLLIIWVPRMVTGDLTPFQWGEVVSNFVLVAASWVVVDSYGGSGWLTARAR